MMKKRGFLVGYVSIVSMLLLSMVVSTTVARYVKDAESGGSYGEVSIRSYYDSGKGTRDEPYVLTRPIHLYNLSRLQALGVYGLSGEKQAHFQLGKAVRVGDDVVYRCYADDNSNDLDRDYLDMNNYSRSIEAIGSETTPFFGEFNGNNLEIRNLTVYADPQDAGLFGYTAHASKVHDLFLDNITIKTRGYSKTDRGLSNLYSGQVSKFNPSFHYARSGTSWEYTPASSITTYQDAFSFTVDWENASTEDEGPTVQWGTNYSGAGSFKYKLLPSGGLLSAVDDTSESFTVDTDALIGFFANAKIEPNAIYPLTASSSMSILAYMTNSGGYLRSRVLLTLSFDFALASSTSDIISCTVHREREHGNNIGLIIGHCDGTVDDCYVHDGKFIMNDGDSSQYQAMANGSDMGLIGVHGNTVKNIASEDAGVSARTGTTVGVLDFSKIYETIAGTNPTFTKDTTRQYKGNDGNYYNPYKYAPDANIPDYYKSLLRRQTISGSPVYFTAEPNSVTFKGQEVIAGTDLGVFKIATDHASNGIEGNVTDDGMAHTVVRKETPRSTLYYSTGEYRKYNDDGSRTNETFDNYQAALTSDTPSRILLGHHFPFLSETTWQSFSRREMQQNYFIRFQMDQNRDGFYFSDLDRTTVGGSFLTKYLEYKLVDENNNHVYVDNLNDHIESAACGITFKDRVTKLEIANVSASFATRDLSNTADTTNKMWCINNEAENFPVANMVNFDITTDWANVTIVAASQDSAKSSALGVYKIADNEYRTVEVVDAGQTITYRYVNRNFNNPDYAFFMPNKSHLAYFDYKVCAVDNNGNESESGTVAGRIGTYSGNTFKQATYGTPATVPGAKGASEYGHSSGDPRLFVHTFKLPQGHYCLGSPTGTATEGLAPAKIYYVAAQGQEEGDIDFFDNTFGEDIVNNIDFLKTSRSNIKIPDVDTIGPGDADNVLEKQRCYVMLAENDRSSFAAQNATLSFQYINGNMVIQAGANNADLAAMTKVVVSSYANRYGGNDDHPVSGLTNTGVILFNASVSTEDIIKYIQEVTP